MIGVGSGDTSGQLTEFSLVRTSTVGAESMDRSLRAGGAGRRLQLQLDTSSRLFVFARAMQSNTSQDAYAWLGPPWAEPLCRDEVCTPTSHGIVRSSEYIEAFYDGVDTQASLTTPLQWLLDTNLTGTPQPYTTALNAARNYDIGLCDVVIPWSTLAAQVNEAVFTQVLAGVQSDSAFGAWRETSTQSHRVNALLRRQADGSSDDRLVMRFEQVARITSSPVTPEVIAAEQLVLNPVMVDTDVGRRLRLDLVQSEPTWIDYPSRFVFTQVQSARIARELGAQLPAQLATVLNDSLRVPVDFGGQAMECDPTAQTNSTVRATCEGSFSAIFPPAQVASLLTNRIECLPFESLPAAQRRSPTYRSNFCARRPNAEPAQIGFCAIRIEPMRVQVLPTGLQLVLLDDNASPRATFMRDTVIPTLRRDPTLQASCDTDRAAAIRARMPRQYVIKHDHFAAVAGRDDHDTRCVGEACAARVAQSLTPVELPRCGQ